MDSSWQQGPVEVWTVDIVIVPASPSIASVVVASAVVGMASVR